MFKAVPRASGDEPTDTAVVWSKAQKDKTAVRSLHSGFVVIFTHCIQEFA